MYLYLENHLAFVHSLHCTINTISHHPHVNGVNRVCTCRCLINASETEISLFSSLVNITQGVFLNTLAHLVIIFKIQSNIQSRKSIYLSEHPASFILVFLVFSQVALCWTGCVYIMDMHLQKRRRRNCVTECWSKVCCTPSAMAPQSSMVTALSQHSLM